MDNPILSRCEDTAVLPVAASRLAFTTDGYVVDPIFFPGGDIGKLAVNGTINDLAMQGACPIGLSLALILEEGFPLWPTWSDWPIPSARPGAPGECRS